MLEPKCEVIICGNDPGVKEIAAEFGLMQLPNIKRNEYGTPLLNSAFDQVRISAKNRLLCYANADIIFLSGLTKAVSKIRFEKYLMVGQRWDTNIEKPLNYEDKDWEAKLIAYVISNGVQASPNGIDYFVFPRESEIGNLPPFAVGRPCWDNWFIQHVRQLNYPVIDATKAVMAIHQTHGYGHVKDARDETWNGPEGDQNRALMGNIDTPYIILDSTYFVIGNRVMRAITYKYMKRRFLKRWQKIYKKIPYRETIKKILNKISTLNNLR